MMHNSIFSYAECFISENLIRKYIEDKSVVLPKEATKEIAKMKEKESTNKNSGNISIDIRRSGNDLSYLSMDDLANLVDKILILKLLVFQEMRKNISRLEMHLLIQPY